MNQPDGEFTRPNEESWSGVRDFEAPTADALAQATPVDPTELPSTPHVLPEVDEYDALEQAQIVPDVDDEYR